MISVDFTNVNLEHLVTHKIGNKLRDEGFVLSSKESSVNENTVDYLLKYFLSQFKPIDFHKFTHPVDLEMNEIFTILNAIFSKNESFLDQSKNIAKLLYNHSSHPKIKAGELNVVYFSGISFENKYSDAIGIFKSESNVPFIKMNGLEERYLIDHEFGFELKGIDKGCIVFNTNFNEGYRALIIDNANKFGDAQYWIDDFLQLKPISDDYHNTKDFMNIAKNFVSKGLEREYEIDKTDKIDLLNRTMDYFKTNDSFSKEDFESHVFQDEEIIESFRSYDQAYRSDNGIELNDNFEISTHAVKKQSRSFKSILKLDKNFHVYIHGDKDLIEKGVESDGRKYYKIYYQNEA
jgi:hypothetical protein